MNTGTYAVTIGHQIGSGGAYIGEKLAQRLEIPFLDREILQKVARQLDLMDEEVKNREERLSTYWESFARQMIWADPALSGQIPRFAPSDSELFEVERDAIRQIAAQSSAVFLGRCGWDILKDHPRHVSILLTANRAERVQRVSKLYRLSDQDAQKLIETNDRERDNYNKQFTKKNWLDARYYDLCINTSTVGWECAIDLAEKCAKAKIQELASNNSTDLPDQRPSI